MVGFSKNVILSIIYFELENSPNGSKLINVDKPNGRKSLVMIWIFFPQFHILVMKNLLHVPYISWLV